MLQPVWQISWVLVAAVTAGCGSSSSTTTPHGESGASGATSTEEVGGGGTRSYQGGTKGQTTTTSDGALGGSTNRTNANTSTLGGSTLGTQAAGGAPVTSGGCPGTGGPLMVKLPQGYCIDRTEVSRDEYAAWLATSPALPQVTDVACGSKSASSYEPDATCMADPTVCHGASCGRHPQVCVDWCDATAYCAGVGKHLCGRIGGGDFLLQDYRRASVSQWYSACSSAGAYTYPYGSNYNPKTCNGYLYWSSSDVPTTLEVGSQSLCQTLDAYRGVFDMAGNVAEWEDSCSRTDRLGQCALRGGSFANIGSPSCADDSINDVAGRLQRLPYAGIRCCSL